MVTRGGSPLQASAVESVTPQVVLDGASAEERKAFRVIACALGERGKQTDRLDRSGAGAAQPDRVDTVPRPPQLLGRAFVAGVPSPVVGPEGHDQLLEIRIRSTVTLI